MHAWDAFLKQQAQTLGYEVVKKWLRPLKILKFDAANLYLEAKDAFQAIWFEEHIRPKIKTSFVNNNNKPIKVHLSVVGATEVKKKQEVTDVPPPFTLNFDQLDPSFTFENFYQSEGLELPYKVLCKTVGYEAETKKLIPGGAELGTFNPIFVSGKPGTGKTHLLQAAAHSLRDRGLNVVYARAQTFTDHVIWAIRAAEMGKFREAYRKADVLIIDDVHVFGKKRATQEEFFHSFNALQMNGKQIILSANCLPSDLAAVEPRLISRFEWGIVLPLKSAEKRDVKEILQMRAHALSFKLPVKVADFLQTTFTNNLKSLNRALEALILRLHLNHSKAPLSIPLIKHHLSDLILEEERAKLTSNTIIKEVAGYFELEPEDVIGRSQQRECVLPRQVAMFLCREKLKLPYTKIGELFSRDHSTVMSSVKLIKKGVENNTAIITAPLFTLTKNLQ
jgi:chromosomal replication initiator protein